MTKREDKILEELYEYIQYFSGEYLNLDQKRKIKGFLDEYKKYSRKV